MWSCTTGTKVLIRHHIFHHFLHYPTALLRVQTMDAQNEYKYHAPFVLQRKVRNSPVRTQQFGVLDNNSL